MKIDLTEVLRKVGNESHLHLENTMSFPDDGLVLTRPVQVDIDLVNTGDSVLLQGSLSTEAELVCSRCSQNYQKSLAVKLKEEYVKDNLPLSGNAKNKGVELKEEDFVYPIEKDNTIDLTEIIRQNLLLTLPIKNLCGEECKP